MAPFEPDPAEVIPTDLFVQKGPLPVDFKKSIEDELNRIVPKDAKAVFLGVAKRGKDGQSGIAFAAGWNVGQGWQVGGEFAWDGDAEGQVMVMKVWK